MDAKEGRSKGPRSWYSFASFASFAVQIPKAFPEYHSRVAESEPGVMLQVMRERKTELNFDRCMES